MTTGLGLGLDVGVGLTKLARAGPGQTGAAPVRAVQTAGFPALLGRGASRWPAAGARAPAEVAREFLRLVLGEAARGGPSAPAVVLAVPPGGLGRELTTVLAALGRPTARQLATPVAALLYLRHARPDIASASYYIVCDLGASAVTLSLCAVVGGRLRVVAFSQVTSISSVQAGPRDAAELGGRPPFLVEALALALTGAGPADRGTSVRHWRELEDALADDGRRDRLDAVLEYALADPTRYNGTVGLRIGSVAVPAAQFLRACVPIADRCAAELTRLLRRQQDRDWLRPGGATRVVLTGGLSTLRPVRAALLRTAGLDPAGPDPAVVALDGAEALYAPALGAALVAAGLAEPGDRYPHALRLPLHRQVRDQIVPGYLELAAAGSIDVDLAEPVYATGSDEVAEVQIRAAADVEEAIPVEVVLAGSGAVKQAAFSPAEPPPPGRYGVGVRGHPNGAAIVLRPAGGGDPLIYPLEPQEATPEGGDDGP